MVIRHLFVVAAALILGGSRSDAAVIRFDSVDTSSGPVGIGVPVVIEGFTFESVTTSAAVFPSTLGAGSNPNSLVLAGGSVKISRATPFNFDQLLAGNGVGNLFVNGTNFGTQLTVLGAVLSDANPLFSNLTSYIITSDIAGNLVLDDITLSEVSVAAVPEPASAAFLGLGSLALVVRRLRRRNTVIA
jgi:hypothetical protein